MAMSAPILVANATPWRFDFSGPVGSANVMIVFYNTLAAADGDQITPYGTGSRDLTATTAFSAYRGEFRSPGEVHEFTPNIFGGTIAAVSDGLLREIEFGSGLRNVIISAAANTTPGGALTYRIVVPTAEDATPA